VFCTWVLPWFILTNELFNCYGSDYLSYFLNCHFSNIEFHISSWVQNFITRVITSPGCPFWNIEFQWRIRVQTNSYMFWTFWVQRWQLYTLFHRLVQQCLSFIALLMMDALTMCLFERCFILYRVTIRNGDSLFLLKAKIWRFSVKLSCFECI
jgi:hypothetical protein